MEQYAQQLIDFIVAQHNVLGLSILAACALIEYIFPPFPGDTVTLFGAVLVARYGWNIGGVYGAVLAGSLVGAMGTYYFGRYVGDRYTAGRFLRGAATRAAVDRVISSFAKHGEVYIALNRFLPAVRSVFFLAAGIAMLRASRVALWSLISAALWNALIIGAGFALGANWERLRGLFRSYSIIVWTLLAVAALLLAARWWRKKKISTKISTKP